MVNKRCTSSVSDISAFMPFHFLKEWQIMRFSRKLRGTVWRLLGKHNPGRLAGVFPSPFSFSEFSQNLLFGWVFKRSNLKVWARPKLYIICALHSFIIGRSERRTRSVRIRTVPPFPVWGASACYLGQYCIAHVTYSE